MNVQRDTWRFASASALFFSCLLGQPVQAQHYPVRPVKVVVASVPGSAPDVLARVIGERLATSLKQPVLVENKPGAGGVIGVDSVAKASADGYTLVIGHDGTMALATIIHKKLPYDPLKDFAPVAPLAINEFVLVAHPSVPVRSFAEFLAYVKAKQGKATYGSAGVGTPNQLFMEQLARAGSFSMVHVPYKGGAAAVSDLVGGQLEFMMAGLAPALPHIRSGKLVAIAVPQGARSKVLPDTPTVGETIKGFAARTWFGLFAPAKTNPDIVTRLNREVRQILDAPDVKEKLAQQGLVIETGDASTLTEYVRGDIVRYRALAKEINLEAQN